jgi:hypothetical protein
MRESTVNLPNSDSSRYPSLVPFPTNPNGPRVQRPITHFETRRVYCLHCGNGLVMSYGDFSGLRTCPNCECLNRFDTATPELQTCEAPPDHACSSCGRTTPPDRVWARTFGQADRLDTECQGQPQASELGRGISRSGTGRCERSSEAPPVTGRLAP